MKKCKSCQTEIDEKATKCPNCQTDQRGFVRRHPILTAILGLIAFSVVVGAMSGDTATNNTGGTPTVTASPTEQPTDVTPVAEVTQSEPTNKAEEVYTPTLGERNALNSALDYLDYTAFSYSGLVKQLEYEGYTNAEAIYGADNSGADWNEQAGLSAKNYLENTAFSREGLIAQLEYEGFTREQAEYGAKAVGY